MMVVPLDPRTFDHVTISVGPCYYVKTGSGEKPPQTYFSTGGGFTGELSDTEQYFRDCLGVGEGLQKRNFLNEINATVPQGGGSIAP